MFSAPVDSKETQISTVPDNGHAMAAYIMIVGLWVGARASAQFIQYLNKKVK